MGEDGSRRAARLAALSDAALSAMAAQGDRDAFAALVPRVSPPLRSLLRRMGAAPALADDVAQDALMTALRRLSTYRGEGAFVGWVMRIAARLYLRRLRRDAREELTADPESGLEPASSGEGVSNARLDLDRALARLSAGERLCVSLCHGAGMSHAEIAGATGLPLGTVKSHVGRGLIKLRRFMLCPDADNGGQR
jgi:RNA polymerase sigma-70 factor (ECF subfamily)